jgi:hypothetical protein
MRSCRFSPSEIGFRPSVLQASIAVKMASPRDRVDDPDVPGVRDAPTLAEIVAGPTSRAVVPETAQTITPITTMRRWPAMSASLPPNANSAASDGR